jgi:hypothetical protein
VIFTYERKAGISLTVVAVLTVPVALNVIVIVKVPGPVKNAPLALYVPATGGTAILPLRVRVPDASPV